MQRAIDKEIATLQLNYLVTHEYWLAEEEARTLLTTSLARSLSKTV